MTTQDLSAENRQLGWAQLPAPPECPQGIYNRILERRAFLLQNRDARPTHPQRAPMSAAAIRAKAAEITAQLVAERIAETRVAIQYTDERGNVAFRGPTDEEWTLSQKKRALELATIVHDELVEEDRRDPRGSYVWNWREGAYVKRGDKC